MLIRPAVLADLPAMLDLMRQLHLDDPALSQPEPIWRAMLAMSGMTVLVADIDGRAVATCTLNIIPHLARGGRPYGLIENVVTDAGHRQQGLGRAVLDAACTLAWEADCYKVMLMTGSKLEATLQFYRQSGFTADKTAFQRRNYSVIRSD